MILKLFNFENDLEFTEDSPGIILVEEKRLFLNIVKSVYLGSQKKKNKENILIFENDKIVNIEKEIIVCSDFFNSPLQERKVTTKLYNIIERNLNINADNVKTINNCFNQVNNIITDSTMEYDFDILMQEEILLTNYLKAIGLKFNHNSNNYPYENIIEIIDVVSELMLYKGIILIDVLSKLEGREANSVLDRAKQKKTPLLLIENGMKIEGIETKTNILKINEFYEDLLMTV